MDFEEDFGEKINRLWTLLSTSLNSQGLENDLWMELEHSTKSVKKLIVLTALYLRQYLTNDFDIKGSLSQVNPITHDLWK